jgi:hypothetical protein
MSVEPSSTPPPSPDNEPPVSKSAGQPVCSGLRQLAEHIFADRSTTVNLTIFISAVLVIVLVLGGCFHIVLDIGFVRIKF